MRLNELGDQFGDDGASLQLLAGVVADINGLNVTVDVDGLLYGPGVFMPRGTTNPSVGDSCLVAIDDEGRPWVVGVETEPVVIPPVRVAAPIVSALPTTPSDGQEVFFLSATMSTPWHLRYRAGSGSAFKWEFVGGTAIEARSGSSGSFPTVASTPGVNVNITAPLAGEYEAQASAYFDWGGSTGAAGNGTTFRTFPGFSTGTAFPADSWGGLTAMYPVFIGRVFVPPGRIRRNMAAGEVVRWAGEQQTNNTNTTTNCNRILTLIPVRVG